MNDPILDEIRKIREELLAEHGGMDGYMRHLQDMKLEFMGRIVRREPRKPEVTKRSAS